MGSGLGRSTETCNCIIWHLLLRAWTIVCCSSVFTQKKVFLPVRAACPQAGKNVTSCLYQSRLDSCLWHVSTLEDRTQLRRPSDEAGTHSVSAAWNGVCLSFGYQPACKTVCFKCLLMHGGCCHGNQ